MRDHLVGDTPCVAADTSGIETNTAVEPLGPAHLVLARGSACTARRNRFDRSANWTAGRLSEPSRAWRRLGLVLFERHLGTDQKARQVVFRDVHHFPATQTAVAPRCVVEAFGIGEGILLHVSNRSPSRMASSSTAGSLRRGR